MRSFFAALFVLAPLLGFPDWCFPQNKSEKVNQLSLLSESSADREQVIARLERLIPKLMSEGDVPGLSIAFIRDSKVFWHRNFGLMNVDTGRMIGDDTVFEAASLTKPVFAYAVLKLADKGKLNLDTPLVRYLPEPAVPNDERANLITARMVLTHETGFQNEVLPGNRLKIHFKPGEKFSYSGEGFLYLQKVVEHITGKPIDVFMKETVFEPLGITSAGYLWRDEYETLKASGHNSAGVAGAGRKPTVAKMSSGLHITAPDYAKLLIAMTKGEGLKKETFEKMFQPQIGVDETCISCLSDKDKRLSRNIFWGLGWGIQRTQQGDAVFHWGENNGEFHTFVMAYPKEKTGLVIFTNSGNGHSIIPEMVSEAFAASHPIFAWMNYERYNSPAKAFYRDILARGEAAIKQYRDSQKNVRNSSPLNEQQINRIGYWLLGKKKIGEAIEVFKLNVEDFPNSANAYDSLAEAYMVNGDKELAIKNYKRSIELDPNNRNGIEMLKKLEGKN